ncbi:DNA cytosine methyltransferase [Providencia rettgeri]|uniref:DNA cytosine methyltransferase n=1 Tax=Providencia TaxID=586 RepID=UPI00155EDD2B|nr:DNA cytosine methyltransferase [Providencia rettgeri]MCJ2225097.1 DNA cytosine methyltransferase [Providencia rettgeri]MCK8630667.1 DNA cytosine methyltransferase [Providencia rettgeri]MDI7241863.1 DNA cytosine methyltransferase [Providencia rettgeri]MDY0822030.1 DNA cytosine methyltransferase [Providencia rettgeri]QKG44392.1 DNA cytosine methyltransferase [Providencia rettgeri]
MSIKAIDLFSGAGGFSLSATNAGVQVLAAIELDRAAAKTYETNFNVIRKMDVKVLDEDINNIDIPALRADLELSKGELDLILGGPPCQGFSSHRIKNAGVDDPRNKLLLRYFEFVHEFQPKAFLVENVSGLLWERHEPYLKNFLSLASKEGYYIHFCGTINAKDYGVPQNRKRVFILGLKSSLDVKNIEFPPPPTHFSPSSGIKPVWRAASSVFEKLPKELYEKYWNDYFCKKTALTKEQAFELLSNLESGLPLSIEDTSNVHMNPSNMMIQRFMRIGLNGSREDLGEDGQLKCHSDGYKGHKDVYGRIFIHQPSNTITAGCNNPSKGRFIHPWKNHGITLRHAARLQSFDDDFIFCGNNSEQAQQIGNAVPPLLGEILIKKICSELNL